jgi:hypothetical protein
MKCRRLAGILADFQEGLLSPGEKQAAAEHLEACPDCRELLAIAHGISDIIPGSEREQFTLDVLSRTSGSVCPRVESGLWDFAGGGPESEESTLIALHLEHCSGCRILAEEIYELHAVLPAIAEIDPGESFTREVIGITSARRAGQVDLPGRILAWWDNVIRRPLFPLESAYVAALFFLFAFSPFLPLRNLVSDKLSSDAIQPFEERLVSVWAESKVPASNYIKKLSSVVVRSNQSVAASVGNFSRKTGHAATVLTARSLQDVQGWRREGTADLFAFWQRVSGWTLRK